MARAVTMVITGDKQVNRMLAQLKATEGKKVVRKAARAGIKVVLPAAKRYSPVGSGKLRRAIKVRAMARSRSRIGARITIGDRFFQGETFYGGFQEWGWRVGKRQGKTAEQKAARRKIAGKYFLKRAADSKRRSALTVYRHEIKRGFEEITRRNGAR